MADQINKNVVTIIAVVLILFMFTQGTTQAVSTDDVIDSLKVF